ncbi:hypothetical protein OJF2_25590 [Aquisphaera giovannonii]|uniref:Uncharacterized protein n=1 Tax=Aquisphaera giovannonii TaxID=406548 RepID=A0A5B9W036_9BACT|nr:hypothetical protein [Aquisphaera giovannonii]QEH34026.1 hypothetical protein OJF2_25590 [Aquisphaera giovannonii]
MAIDPEPPSGPPEASSIRPAAAPATAASPRLVLFVALIAGLAAWLAGESPPVIRPPEAVKTDVMGFSVVSQTAESARAADRMNAVRYFGLSAAIAGLAMAWVGSILGRGSLLTKAMVVLFGAIACGSLAGLSMPLFEYGHAMGLSEMVDSMLVHLLLWLPVGGLVGLTLGLSGGRPREIPARMFAGMVGAGLGVVLYEMIGGIALPTGGAGLPLPREAGARLAALLLVLPSAAFLAARATSDASASSGEQRSGG